MYHKSWTLRFGGKVTVRWKSKRGGKEKVTGRDETRLFGRWALSISVSNDISQLSRPTNVAVVLLIGCDALESNRGDLKLAYSLRARIFESSINRGRTIGKQRVFIQRTVIIFEKFIIVLIIFSNND